MDQILVQKKKIIQPNQKKRSTYKTFNLRYKFNL